MMIVSPTNDGCVLVSGCRFRLSFSVFHHYKLRFDSGLSQWRSDVPVIERKHHNDKITIKRLCNIL